MTALGAATWPAVADSRRLLLLPLGSTEQHGPHLPLDTDTRVAVAVADGVASRISPVLVAPALPFGASGEHAGFPGTLSLGTAGLELALVELVRSADLTASAVVVINGHGGNAAALRAARQLLAAEGRPVFVWAPSASLATEVGIPDAAGDLHAGRSETSLLLYLAPELVRIGKAVAGPSPSVRELMDQGVAALSSTGVLGDPARANAEEGARLLDAYVRDAADRIVRWADARHITPPVTAIPAVTARTAPPPRT